jgi:hypothetical protein
LSIVGLIWHDIPQLAVPFRDELRAKAEREGQKARFMIRDATLFAFADLEEATVIYLFPCNKKDEIIAAYRSNLARNSFGDVEIVDVETGLFNEAVAVPELPVQPEPELMDEAERDLLDGALENRSDGDLRSFILAATGVRPPPRIKRANLLAMAREAAIKAEKPVEPVETRVPL